MNSELTLHNLASQDVPAQESRFRVGNDDAGSTLLQGCLMLLARIGREGDESVIQVTGLGRHDARLAEPLELRKVVSLHHLEATFIAVKDNLVSTNCDRSWGRRDQSSAGRESKDLSEVHFERVYESRRLKKASVFCNEGSRLL